MTTDGSLKALAPFVGEWSMAATFETMPPADVDARVIFERHEELADAVAFAVQSDGDPRARTLRPAAPRRPAPSP